MLRFLLPAVLPFLLLACAPKATPGKAMEIALRYKQLEWQPEAQHVRHGNDSKGIRVDTPDTSLSRHGERGGWWVPGEPARSMPYKWGGFDTPESFFKGLEAGKKAGDVATKWKIDNGDAVVSTESVGIDCSGFVSRCWLLPRPYSTRELPSICAPLQSWDELRTGDILLKEGHVILFEKWNADRTEIIGYEAGPRPFWGVHSCGISKSYLIGKGYHPWRYRYMKAD
ncbi:MAG: hypothetical protein KF712_04970 [Akkermansiaceae bacterium]|nr:hypothetical protein [Akkermansiaceae bacterium]